MLTALLIVAAPVEIVSSSPALDFRYRWSAEAAAVPALDRRFRREAAKLKAKWLKDGREYLVIREKMGGGAVGYMLSVDWTTAGSTPRLLSLERASANFSGGAHGNSGTSSLLWDRRLAREVKLDALLLRPGWWNGAIRQPFCTLLDRERAKRRQEQVKRGEWPNQCPELKDLTLTLEDKDRDRRFDHLSVTADPYVAGAYAEGEYVISLPLTAAMLARLKPEYRASFEAQPPVQ